MPIHSRITSINSFATGKTERVPIVSEYIEDYFHVKTNRPLDNTVANNIETKGIDWTKAADDGTGEAEGLMWLKKLYETDDHSLWPKVNTDMVVDGRNVGNGSAYLLSNGNQKLQNGTANMSGTSGAGIKFEKDAFTIERSDLISNVYTTNSTMDPMVYFSFKKKKKFFDIKVYEGNQTAGRVINHDLDCVPGSVWIKSLSTVENWMVYHKYGTGADTNIAYKYYYDLANTNAANFIGAGLIEPVGTTHVTLNVDFNQINKSGEKYVIIFFADTGSGGFGDDGSLDGIACGSGTVGDWNSTDAYQDLGFEPQWVLVKGYSSSESTQPWCIVDSQRNMYSEYQDTGSTNPARSPTLNANSNAQQANTMSLFTDGGGFYIRKNQNILSDGDKYIYIAIAKPQRTAIQQNMFLNGVGTGATNFFSPTTVTAGVSKPTVRPGFSPDSAWIKINYNEGAADWNVFNRKVGFKEVAGMSNARQYRLRFNSSGNKDGGSDVNAFYGNGFYANSDGTYNYDANDIFYLLKKTPHFYDTQHTFLDGTNPKVVKHSLGKKPELMISKTTYPGSAPSIGAPWWMYSSAPGLGYTMTTELESNPGFTSGNVWGAEPTASTFTLGSIGGSVSGSGWAHTMLFSSCPGVSKVGFYTGTGSTLVDVDCEFASAPRFVFIQRVQGGKRYIWDSLRGMTGFGGAGEQLYSSPGDYTWTAPSGVTSISAVLVGGGGGGGSGANGVAGGGGGLAYKNNISVSGGDTITVKVGGGGFATSNQTDCPDGSTSQIEHNGTTYAVANGGKGGDGNQSTNNWYDNSNSFPNTNSDGGGMGGAGFHGAGFRSGGGGAGGYSGGGNTGRGRGCNRGNYTDPEPGQNGGGGGGHSANGSSPYYSNGGGGTGVYGQGSNGTAGQTGGSPSNEYHWCGGGGSTAYNTGLRGYSNNSSQSTYACGTDLGNGYDRQNQSNYHGQGGGTTPDGGFPGGGAAGANGGSPAGWGGNGIVRIVWGSVSGVNRSFPSTNVDRSDQYEATVTEGVSGVQRQY